MALRKGDDLLGGGGDRGLRGDAFTAALKAPTYHLAWKRRRPPVARAQRRLWSRLKPLGGSPGKAGKPGPHSLIFQRDYPIMLGPDMGVIADIACVDLALIVEITDDMAIKRMNQAELDYQTQVDAALADADWQVLSLWYRDVMERMDGCLIQLDRAIARAKAAMD